MAVPVLVANSFAGQAISFNLGDNYPPVELLSPVTQDIDLTGKPTLQFKWKQTDFARTDRYEFRLYKGYDTVEANLILRQNIPNDQYPLELPAENFAVGEVYVWTLKQVSLGGIKSDIAISPFKIIKK